MYLKGGAEFSVGLSYVICLDRPVLNSTRIKSCLSISPGLNIEDPLSFKVQRAGSKNIARSASQPGVSEGHLAEEPSKQRIAD